MNKLLFASLLLSLFSLNLFAQGGMWTWMRGDGNTSLSAGSYGTQGVTAVTNNPPARYNTSHWIDTAGNFWIFGGFRNNGTNFTDLWKYDPNNNVWTWIKGNMNGAGAAGNFGTQGVAAATNNPPANSLTSVTWTDTLNNLWLYHKFGDLWKYTMLTNEWTWMKGSGVAGQTPIYGVQGIPASANTPGSNIENKAAWTDSLNNLWLYNKGNMWKYSILTNEWTWMKGNSSANVVDFGTQGVPGPTVQPEQEDSYIQWQDRNDNFYIATNGLPGTSSTVWMYHMDLNQWEWHSGDSALNSGTQNRKFISQCVASIDRDPGHRLEARGCNYLDRKGCTGDSIFWFYGGAHSIPPLIPNNNDLWIYNRLNNTWKWVSGDSTLFTAGNYGVQGVPSLTTMPYSMNGHAMWVDKNQQVWVWGGKSDVAINNNNMWRFTPDTSCVQWTPNQFAVLSQPPNSKICLGDSVLLSILPSQTYTVAPSFGTAINAANTEISFHPTSTTTYTITASSNQDCVVPTIVSFTIQVDTLPLVNPLMNDTICNGQSALLSVSNPPVGMQFLWLPMNTSGSSVFVTPLSNTVYTLVSGYSGSACPSDTQTVSVIVSNLTWNSVSSVNVLCFGGANGSINTNALGTGSILYTIQPLNINNSTGVFTGLTAGVYTLIASDAGNCSLTTLVSVVQPAPIVANIVTSTQPSCNTTTGTLQAFASGGTGTLSYTLQPLGITNTTGYFNNLAQGVYTVVATDGNACSASTTLNLFAPNAVQIQNVTTTSSGCNGINTGSAVINANGNATPFQFSIGGPFQLSNNFTNLASGNYTVIVVDTNGCSDTTNFSILTKNPPTISSLTLQQPLCPAEADGSASVIAFGDTTLVSIVLQPGNNNQSNGIFTQLASGSYTITVTDASGCSTTTAFTMIEPPAITVQISQVINSVCNVSELGSIQSSAFGGNGALTFTLLPPNITNITGYFDQLLPGKYQVVVTDSKNCMKGDSVEITRIPCCKDIEIPNAFTPNGDLLNDELKILNADHIELIKFVIANRWGNLVYESETLSSWNGTYKNEPAASDTYYYFVTYKCKLDGKEYMKKGDIILLR